jgi:hypothetical protein
VWVNDIDWTVLPLDADIGKGGTTTCEVAFEDQPFAYYAGPRAGPVPLCARPGVPAAKMVSNYDAVHQAQRASG